MKASTNTQPASRPVTDVEIKNKLEHGFDQEKRCQHESEPGETGERLTKVA